MSDETVQLNCSFVMGFHSARMDNVLQTLRLLHKFHPEVTNQSQLVTLCQNSCQESQLLELQEKFGSFMHLNLNLECMKLPVVSNIGVEHAQHDRIILLESDRILPKGYFSAILPMIQPGINITCHKTRKLLKPASDEDIEQERFEYRPDDRSVVNLIGQKNMWSGNTAFWKDDYYKAGKMDENYTGYGWADSDMTKRMEKIDVKLIFRPEMELHLWHPPATYGSGDQKQMFINNGLRFCRIWKQKHPAWFIKEMKDHPKKIL